MHTHPNPPTWLLALRSGTGVVLLMSFWNGWPDHAVLYANGWWPAGTATPVDGLPLLLLYSALCLSLTLGFLPRIVAALLLPLHHFTFLQVEFLSYGFDYLCATALFYCAVIPSRPSSRWPLRMVQVTLCIVYASAGAAKALGSAWWTGDALWKAATLPGFEGVLSPIIHQLGAFTVGWMVAGWLVIGMELLYPVFIWFRFIRPVWLGLIMAMHLSIALVMGLYGFSALMVLFNWVAFCLPYQPRWPLFQRIPFNYRLPPIRVFRWRAKPSQPRHETADYPTYPDV